MTPCDTGRRKSVLAEAFPELLEWEGFNELPELWWATRTEYGIFGRIRELEAWISARPEQTIALVGHGGLFSRMLGVHLHNCGHQWVEWPGPAANARELM